VSAALAAVTVQRNREYRSSLTIAETVVARWPTAFGRTMLGVELAAAGRHQEAMPLLRDAAPSFPTARYHLGGELFNAGKYADAIEQLQEFVRLKPYLLEAVRARTMLGRAYLAAGKPADAIEQLRMVLSMTSSSDEAHVTAIGFLGDALFAQQKFADALPYYRTFVAARPRDSGAMTNYAITLAETGDASGAIAAFHRAVDINPADTTARRNLAKALFNQGRVDEAEAETRSLLQVQPSDSVGHDLLGRALASKGRLSEARAEFERALASDPRDAQARADLALVVRAMGSR
jgi:tetratricopeptide (TPR) repeat protein